MLPILANLYLGMFAVLHMTNVRRLTTALCLASFFPQPAVLLCLHAHCFLVGLTCFGNTLTDIAAWCILIHALLLPPQLSLQLLAGRSANPATAGLLADALHLLALGMEEAPQRARQDLRLKLLLLYSDVGARVGGGGAGSVAAADLGNLLAAVAVAAEGLQPGTLRLLGRSSSSRMSMHDIQVGWPTLLCELSQCS